MLQVDVMNLKRQKRKTGNIGFQVTLNNNSCAIREFDSHWVLHTSRFVQ